MNGAVTIESLKHDLDTMKSLGFRAVTVQAGGGMTTTYLTPEYFAFFKQFVEEARKRDMKVWIVDEIGYPSGFAGGMFTKSKTELRMQGLDITQRIPVKGGEALNQAVGANAVVAVATNASFERIVVGTNVPAERVAVPINNGSISWTAPAGPDWTVEVIGHEFRTAPTRSDANPTHAKDGSNSIEDYMNPEATAAYIQVTHQGYYDAMPELFGKPFSASAATSRTTRLADCLGQTSFSNLPAGKGLRHSTLPGRAVDAGGRRRTGTRPAADAAGCNPQQP